MFEFMEQFPIMMALVIFCARVLDVSIGTIRTIMVFRGHRLIAAILGFIEVLIWLVAVGKVMENLDVWYFAIAFAGGFATGNVVGMFIESKLAIGSELVRAVSENQDVELAESLRELGYSVTEMQGLTENDNPVEVLLVEERRRKVPHLINSIAQIDPGAIWTISDIKSRPAVTQRTRTLASAGLKLK